MEAIKKMLGRSRRRLASLARRSTESRARTRGAKESGGACDFNAVCEPKVGCDEDGESERGMMASARATAVAALRERSPITRVAPTDWIAA